MPSTVTVSRRHSPFTLVSASLPSLLEAQALNIIITASIKGEYGWCISNGDRKGLLLERNLNDVFQKFSSDLVNYQSVIRFLYESGFAFIVKKFLCHLWHHLVMIMTKNSSFLFNIINKAVYKMIVGFSLFLSFHNQGSLRPNT